MKQIVTDEIRHVSFGWSWLNKFKKRDDPWDAWVDSLSPMLEPKRAKGFVLREDHRLKANIPQGWIDKLKSC